ncbi:MAG TPA: ABC transporter permease [Flavilitoribacter sp.]|nr:ABC transporter permease [Flavilitoribacter sp.]HMQ86607.1 ABC transporter permease [Flavilitoribacter sp.]
MFRILKKDLQLLFSDRRALLMKFLLPVLLITVFVMAFSGLRDNGGGSRIAKIDLPVADGDQSAATKYMVQKLEASENLHIEPVTEDQALDLVRRGKRVGALVFGKGFSDAYLSQTPLPWRLVYQEGRDMELGILKSVLIPQLIGMDPNGKKEDAPTVTGTQAEGPADYIRNKQLVFEPLRAAKSVSNDPWLVQPVAGIALILLLFNVAGIGGSILEEKESGTLARLFQTPLKPSGLFWGKLLMGVIVSFLQLAIMFLFASLVFGLKIGNNLPGLLLIMLATTFACSSFGLLLAGISKSRAQMQGLAIGVVLVMSAIGGSMIPLFIMPAFMKKIALLSVNYWGLEAFYDLLWRQLPLVQILPRIAVLTGIGLAVTLAAFYLFKKLAATLTH